MSPRMGYLTLKIAFNWSFEAGYYCEKVKEPIIPTMAEKMTEKMTYL